MGMNVATNEEEDDVISIINTTPLVDVMLVLLIIFLITIPVVTHTIPVELPKESNRPRQTKPENINIAINTKGDIFWNDQSISDSNVLTEKLKKVSLQTPQPEVQIRGDSNARYEFIGNVVIACQRAGILKIGFITEPLARGS